MHQIGILTIAALTVLGILLRPKGWPEAVWACAGAALLVILRFLSPSEAFRAIQKGTDVYFFLAGMMLLAEMARREGLFDWLASHAMMAARGSHTRLFSLVYLVGVAVTTLLSNDATAVVLTPAVYAAVKRARASAMPCLFACAFVANAASFVLPISNPANLVVFGRNMPPLASWLRSFALPSLLSVAATYLVLRLICASELRGSMSSEVEAPELPFSGRVVGLGIIATAVLLLIASALDRSLGLPTFIASSLVFGTLVFTDPRAFRPTIAQISWGVLPLVAGLFVIVEALDAVGAVNQTRSLINNLEGWVPWAGSLSASFAVAAVCNVANNLPVGLLVGSALRGHFVVPAIRNALVVGVDLGPNFSVTGSLATILWLIAVRREGEDVSAWTFLKYGLLVTPPALVLATSALLLFG